MIAWMPFALDKPRVPQGVTCLWAIPAPNLAGEKYTYVVGAWRQGQLYAVVQRRTGSLIVLPKGSFVSVINRPKETVALDDAIPVATTPTESAKPSVQLNP
jgi:hypothetical protein